MAKSISPFNKYITRPLIYAKSWCLSILPGKLFYGISDLLFLLIFYVIGYRKKVSKENLKNSFPEKSKKEINRIAKKFYRHFTDTMLEMFVLFRMNPKKAQQFVSFKNKEVVEDYYKQGKNIIGIFGHYGNWELVGLFSAHTKYRVSPVYKKLASPFFDYEFLKMRKRLGSRPIEMHNTLRECIRLKKENIPFVLGLLADQRPPKKSIHFWMDFLNQDTPIFLGPEKIAQKLNCVTVWVKMTKIRRGHYEAEFIPINENPKEAKEFEITRKHVELLEKSILEEPAYWLWTHKRWKHKRNITAN